MQGTVRASASNQSIFNLKKYFLTFLTIIALDCQTAWSMTLSEYMDQVKGQNVGYYAQSNSSKAYEMLQKKALLLTTPTFFATAQTGYNEQIQALNIFSYKKLSTQTYTAGLMQNFSFGLNTTFTYALNKYDYEGLVTSNPIAAHNYQTRPIIEITFPLLRGLFGSITRANRDLVDSQNEAQKHLANYTSISTLISAEQAYWNLAAARKTVDVQTLALNQAQKIYDYVAKRERMNLGDDADVLQARALVESKKLDVKQAQNDVIYYSRIFNRYRYINSEEVSEELDNIDYSQVENFVFSKIKPGSRSDVKAAQSNMRASVASARIEEENSKPSLDLFGSYAFKGVQTGVSDAINNSFTDRGKEGLIGVRFSVPMYIGASIDINRGAKLNASAARSIYRQKAFDEVADWENLISQLEFYQQKTKLARDLEMAQKKKLENERLRLKQGRTTTYQVLLFEKEYSESQVTAIQSARDFFVLIAQKKLYGTSEALASAE